MATMPKTGLRTPAEYTDPFMPQFDDEFATDLDNWIDANAADLKQVLRADSYDQLPWYDQQSGKVKWGEFTIGSPRYANVMTVAAAGEAAMTGDKVLYVDVPSTRPYGGTVVPAVGTLPQNGRDRVIIGVLLGGEKFHLIGRVQQDLLGYGPGPAMVIHIDNSTTTLRHSESGRLFIVDEGKTLTLPDPTSRKQSYFIKCNGTPAQYCILAGGLGTLGFLGPHEESYGAFNSSIRVFGGGGLLRVVAHEPVPGSGDWGWLVRGETAHYSNDSTPTEEWFLSGLSTSSTHYSVGSTPPASPSTGSLWFNTAANWNILMYWDTARSKWLSVETEILSWAHDSADGNALSGFGISVAGIGTGYLVDRDACIVEAAARGRGGNLTKAFRLDKDNAGTPVNLHSFSLAAGVYKAKGLDIDLAEDDDIWAYAAAAGAAAEDVTVSYTIRRRVTPTP